MALIKLFDRVHNTQTIGAKSPEKAKKIVQETMEYFVILAVYLGILNAEKHFYQLCLRTLNKEQLLQKVILSNDLKLPLLISQSDFCHNNI